MWKQYQMDGPALTRKEARRIALNCAVNVLRTDHAKHMLWEVADQFNDKSSEFVIDAWNDLIEELYRRVFSYKGGR